MINRFERFTTLITKIKRSIRSITKINMKEYGLTGNHVSVLYHLYLCDFLTSKELTEKCDEDKATISRTITFLEEKDFINCKSKTKKRYNSPFFLTDKGKVVGKIVTEKVDGILSELSGCLTVEERIKFYKQLSHISKKLENLSNNSKNI